MNVIGYIRVSTAEQGRSGLGTSAQRKAISEHARSKGWGVAWLADDASGKDMDRPALQYALEQLRKGEYGAIVVAKLDRLSRSVIDFAWLLDQSRRQKWGIVVLDFDLDTTTAAGRMLAGVMMQFAQFERELIGERTKAALAAAKERGVQLGRPPEIDPEVAARIMRLRLDFGFGAKRIAQRLNDDRVPTVGGGPWAASTVARVIARLGTPEGLAPYMGVRFEKKKGKQ